MNASSKVLFDIIPVLIVLAIFWFVLIVPMNRKEKLEKEKALSASVGDIVVTRGGIQGKICEERKETVVIQSEKSTLEIRRDAILEITSQA